MVCFEILLFEIINDNIKIHFPQLSMTRDVMSEIGGFLCSLRSSSHNVIICYPISCPDTAVVCYRWHQQSLLFSGGCKQLWEITEISFLLSPCLVVWITECKQWGGRCSCSHVISVPKHICFVSSNDWGCPEVPLLLLFRCQKDFQIISNL